MKAIFPAAVEVPNRSDKEIREQLCSLNSSRAFNKCVVEGARCEILNPFDRNRGALGAPALLSHYLAGRGNTTVRYDFSFLIRWLH